MSCVSQCKCQCVCLYYLSIRVSAMSWCVCQCVCQCMHVSPESPCVRRVMCISVCVCQCVFVRVRLTWVSACAPRLPSCRAPCAETGPCVCICVCICACVWVCVRTSHLSMRVCTMSPLTPSAVCRDWSVLMVEPCREFGTLTSRLSQFVTTHCGFCFSHALALVTSALEWNHYCFNFQICKRECLNYTVISRI